MKISIAMATYNGGKYLREQLQSFLDQTRQPDELIITDDCSHDETEKIVREFKKKAPFKVDFYRNEVNLGYSGNFNAALTKTTGGIVFLSDQDDVWLPNKIEHMVSVAMSNPEKLLLMNDAALTDGYLNEINLTKIGQIRSAGMSDSSFVMGCCCAVRRQLLSFCLPVPEGFKGHDNWLATIAEALEAKLIEPKVLQLYRRHETNESLFIANRTTKVNRFHAFAYSVRKLFAGNRRQLDEMKLLQMKIFSKGVANILDRAPEIYKVRIENLLDARKEKVLVFQSRLYIRKKNFILRFFLIIKLFISNGYRNTSGLKAMLRDLRG